MEYGLIPRLNQYIDNNQVQIQQIQSSNEISSLKNENKELQRDTLLKKIDEQAVQAVSETKEVSTQKVAQYQEVALTNLNFGFNNSSNDFYVKATRGESMNQYPTDEMMKLKAYFIAEAKAQRELELN